MSTLQFPLRETGPRPLPGQRARTLRIGLLGAGKVGQAFLELCRRERDYFLSRGLQLDPVAALVRDASLPRRGLPPRALLTSDPLRFLAVRCDVVVEALGGLEPARSLVAYCLKAGIPVVTANKSLLADHGSELAGLARQAATELRVEAAALAGVPFIATLQERPLAGRFRLLQGILNGTCNFLITELQRGETLPQALAEAQRLGLAEPDPANDIDGQDGAEKLALLCQHLVGRRIEVTGLEKRTLRDLSPLDLEAARDLGGVLRPLVWARLLEDSVEAFTGPAFLPSSHLLSAVGGVDNGLLLEPHCESVSTPDGSGRLFYRGAGAGPKVTAATLLDDLWQAVHSSSAGRLGHASSRQPRETVLRPPRTPWFVRIERQDSCADAGLDDVLALLADHGIHCRGSVEKAQYLWILTSTASKPHIEEACQALAEAASAACLPLRALEVTHV
ncbi:MAG TPA: homoserine dehydrogenase [Acidobacteriota bacterium]|nr:homoserine dehydrogenase [Acidobacteriota bacterium]